MSASGAVRTRPLSLPGVLVLVLVLASIASPWSISIPPAHAALSFGFQTPACWLAVLALIAAAFVELRAAVIAVAVAEAALIAWFGWAMWVVTTPRFASLGFPFVGTDLIGPGWYAAAVALLLAAGAVVKGLLDRETPIGPGFWLWTAIPGYGLIRLGRWSRGLTWTLLFSAALYFASTDSPDPTQFAEYGRTNNVPPALPRDPEWVLLGLAAALWALSIGVTIAQRRRAGRN
ncbi:hypothetical protein EPN29_00175 [bacterium]|nr:MAG: hypothetical protein EPN29_00175 [bacterium]